MLKIRNTLAIRMLEGCGLKTPGSWTLGRLRGKLLSLDNFLAEDKWKDLKDPKLVKLFKRCWKAGINNETGLIVYNNNEGYGPEGTVSFNEEPNMATKKKKVVKKKVAKKKTAKKKTRPDKGGNSAAEPTKKKKRAAKKKTSKKVVNSNISKKKPGVIASIQEFLEKGPVSRESLLKKLTERFPNRSEDSMKNTLSCQLGKSGLVKKGLKVHKDNKDRYSIK